MSIYISFLLISVSIYISFLISVSIYISFFVNISVYIHKFFDLDFFKYFCLLINYDSTSAPTHIHSSIHLSCMLYSQDSDWVRGFPNQHTPNHYDHILGVPLPARLLSLPQATHGSPASTPNIITTSYSWFPCQHTSYHYHHLISVPNQCVLSTNIVSISSSCQKLLFCSTQVIKVTLFCEQLT